MTPEQYAELKEQMLEYKAGQNTLIEQNRAIMDLLTGNKKMDPDDKGIVGKIKALETRLSKLEKFKDRTVWALYGAGAATGWGLTGLLGKLQEVLSKH